MFSEKTPAILTCDKDILRLLKNTPGLMCSQDFSPKNNFFLKRLLKNPFKLYLFHNEEITVPFEFKDLEFHERFQLQGVPYKENLDVKFKMEKLWKYFSDYTDQFDIAPKNGYSSNDPQFVA